MSWVGPRPTWEGRWKPRGQWSVATFQALPSSLPTIPGSPDLRPLHPMHQHREFPVKPQIPGPAKIHPTAPGCCLWHGFQLLATPLLGQADQPFWECGQESAITWRHCPKPEVKARGLAGSQLHIQSLHHTHGGDISMTCACATFECPATLLTCKPHKRRGHVHP